MRNECECRGGEAGCGRDKEGQIFKTERQGQTGGSRPRLLEWGLQAGVSVLLLLALNPSNPYGYYVLLRWICCAAFAFLAVRAYQRGKSPWVWVLGVTAAIYNPLLRVHMDREIWSIVNVATIAIAVASVWGLRRT